MENQEPNEALKIFAVSLVGVQKFKAYAVFDGERLVVTHIQAIPGAFLTWKDALARELQLRRSEGFICIVEERSEYLAQYANQFLLEDVDEDSGRSNMWVALDWYFSLLEMGQIVIAKEYQQYMIRLGAEGQKIEKGQDDKGRPTYLVNWGAINAGHRAMLLCVVGAMIEPVSERYIEDLLKAWLPINEEHDPIAGAFLMVKRFEEKRVASFEKALKKRKDGEA